MSQTNPGAWRGSAPDYRKWDERKEALRKAKAMRISRLAKARHIEQKRLREIIREKKNKTSQ